MNKKTNKIIIEKKADLLNNLRNNFLLKLFIYDFTTYQKLLINCTLPRKEK